MMVRSCNSPLILLALAFLSSWSHAFIFNDFAPFPQLKEMVAAQTDLKLNIKLDIYDRKAKSTPHLFLDGLELSLQPDKAVKGTYVGLPGSEGPHPQTSSGAMTLKVDELPYFIGMSGKVRVPMEKGGWEMVWRKNAMAGTLICGFDIPNEVVRNAVTAKLPSGCVYVTFPVWTPELLAAQQVQKAEAERRHREHDDVKNLKLAEMNNENNFIRKLFLYREAAEAFEKREMSAASYYQWIPSSEGIIEMQPGLLVGTTGSVYSVTKDIFKTKSMIGEARIRVDPKPESEILLP